MGKRLPHTPSSFIVSALRRMWEFSRERRQALKDARYTCSDCRRKQSKAIGRVVKIQCHHKRQPDWKRIVSVIREELLQTAGDYKVVCKECHKTIHQIDS